MSVSIPPEPTPEIIEVLYGGLYRLETKFGRHRARMRYLQVVRLLSEPQTANQNTTDDDVFLRGEMGENY